MTTIFPLASALAVAEYIVQAIQPACHRVEIAESIRRKQAQVHDVDLVAWPIYATAEIETLFGMGKELLSRPGDLIIVLKQWPNHGSLNDLTYAKENPRIIKFIYNSIPVEIYLVEPDGSNFGALLQLRTGSKEFNANLATNAKFKGLHYKAGYGVFNQEDQRLDDDSERRIIELLGMKFIEPEKRR